MSRSDDAVARLAVSVADGDAVDWSREEADLAHEERRLLRHLRLVESIATLHRSAPERGRSRASRRLHRSQPARTGDHLSCSNASARVHRRTFTARGTPVCTGTSRSSCSARTGSVRRTPTCGRSTRADALRACVIRTSCTCTARRSMTVASDCGWSSSLVSRWKRSSRRAVRLGLAKPPASVRSSVQHWPPCTKRA